MRNLKYGQVGAEVAELQRRLTAQGHTLEADGIFGKATEQAVKDFQAAAGLVADGIAGAKTQLALQGQAPAGRGRLLGEADIRAAAELLGVDVASVKAVNKVESNGGGFLKDGRPKILFERHIFYRELAAKHGPATAEKWAAAAPHICNRKPGGYLGGAAEYPRLARAEAIDRDCAHKAASWGLYQIMGFNHRPAGYASISEMVADMYRSEAAHLLAFARFIAADKTLHGYLKNRDWAKFARRYNGPDYRRNAYDTKLAHAYRLFAGNEK